MRKISKRALRVIVQRVPSEKCFGGCGKDMPGPADVCDDCSGWND